MSTSAGPYMKMLYKIQTKHDLFINYNDDDPAKPRVLGYAPTPAGRDLARQVEGILAAWDEQKAVALFIKNNPKVELLPIEEVEINGKIRLFCELDVAANIAFRYILGDYISKCHQFHHQLPSRLGFNPYIFPQTYMAQFSKNPTSIATDIKRLDKNFPTELIDEFFLSLALLAKHPTHKLRLTSAAKSLRRTVHIYRAVLYMVTGGNHSGIAGTTAMNSFAADRCAIYVYVKWAMESGLKLELHFAAFMSNTGLATYGDDQNWLLADSCPITRELIKAGYLDFGLEIVPSKNFDDGSTEFCSRQILFDAKRCHWYARLKKTSITQSLYWLDMGRKENIPEQFLQAQFEASLWDREFFQNVKKEVITQAKKVGIPPGSLKLLGYDTQRDHFAKYIRGHERSPIITEIEADESTLNPYEQAYNLHQLYTMPQYVFSYHRECSERGIRSAIERTVTSRIEDPQGDRLLIRVVNLKHDGYTGQGEDPDLSEAVRLAYRDLYINRFDSVINDSSLFSEPNSRCTSLRYSESVTPDASTTYWAVHSNDELLTTGEEPYLAFGPSSLDLLRHALDTPSFIHNIMTLLNHVPELTQHIPDDRMAQIISLLSLTRSNNSHTHVPPCFDYNASP
ncbi:MAG: RNA-dependent RNA polymerase [Koper picorna-like virus 1]|nr:MAG: RNA-dependent RNA polymerase [Koper picorna-like virus 1]